MSSRAFFYIVSFTMKKLHHIAIAVSDLKKASETFRKLGFKMGSSHPVPGMKVNALFTQVGETQIEFIQPTNPDSTVAKFLERRGEGLHHLCFEVPDIEASLKDYEKKGFVLINKKPEIGAQGKVAFLHPKSTNGVLIELIEKN